jgi:cystathionine gamma-synthase
MYKYEESEIDRLEADLASGAPLDALFTEFPGNPLLQSPNLERLRQLSLRYNFVFVVDDTIGSYANVSILPMCDVTCTSLTKMFSGSCNVMGGAVVLNPSSQFHRPLAEALDSRCQHIDWFPDDAILMNRNGETFVERTRRASHNAAAVAEQLRASPGVIGVYYPKGSPTQHLYDKYKLRDGGYGFMLSIRFTAPARAAAFYNALWMAKGPSLGTNFSLACK